MNGDCQCHVSNKLLKPFYVCDEDELRVGVQTAQSSVVIGVSGLMVNANGERSKFTVTVAAASDRSETVVQNNIGAGWILHAEAWVISGTVGPRQAYVTAHIVSNSGTPAVPMACLLRGYVHNNRSPSFPYDLYEAQTDGQGNIRSVTGSDPAAGAEVSDTVPAGARWRLIAAIFTLVASGAAANRRVHVTLDDGATVYLRSLSGTDITAGQTGIVSFWESGQLVASNNSAQVAMLPSNLILVAGHRIKTVTTALDAGDNYGAPQYLVEEWLSL